MPINKFTTLLDLSRQAKILTGETAYFDGKILSGIPFSGYPTGVDTATTVSLGVISTQTAVFSGGTGTTVFDVSNSLSPNYNPSFDAFSAFTWSDPLFSANTTGLTLPITTLSANTQIVGPFWTLTQTGYTGDYIIGTQYTGYSITYSFTQVSTIASPNLFSGFTTASQENFSAGTLDYKGPLDYVSSLEDATIKGRLTTNKFTITSGANAGYVLTSDSNGNATWQASSGLTGDFLPLSGGTVTGSTSFTNGLSTNTISATTYQNLPISGLTAGNNINISGSSGNYTISVTGLTQGLTGDYLPLSGGTVTGDTIITANLTVSGNSGVNWFSSNTSSDLVRITQTGSGNAFVVEDSSNPDSTPFIINQGGNIGIGTTPQYLLQALSGNSTFYYDPTSAGGKLTLSGNTNLPRFEIVTAPYLTNPLAGGSIGVRAWNDSSFPGYGKVGDMHVYAGNDTNGLNIVNAGPGSNTEDYIRFYAGRQALPANTPDIHIQGSGTTRGYVGINNDNPQYLLDVKDSDSRFYYDPTSVGGRLSLSGRTNLPRFAVDIPPYLSNPLATVSLGMRAWDDSLYADYGNPGDAHLYAGVNANGLNIISETGAFSSDYIRFYAGQDANGTTPDIHIQGSGTTRGYVGINNGNPQFLLDVSGSSGSRFYFDASSLGGVLALSGDTNVPRIGVQTFNTPIISNIIMGIRTLTDVTNTIFGKNGDTFLYTSASANGINIANAPGTGTEDYIKFFAGQTASQTNTPDIHIQGSGTTRGYVGIKTNNPSELLDVNGKTKTINFQMTSGATNGYVLTSDANGNASWQSVSGGTGGVPEATTATTTTINFTGQTIYYNATTPGTGNITQNLTGAKLGLIQKIYHNDVAEPTYPAGWVLMGDAIYFTSVLNIIYAEWAGGSRVEYWYVQQQ